MKQSKLSKRRFRLTTRSKRGTATVELAVCLPLISLLVFGSIQACNLLHLKHALTSAAFEGTLELARLDATSETVETRVKQILNMHNVADSNVTISPQGKEFEELERGSAVEISVEASTSSNLALEGWFPCPSLIGSKAVGPK